MKKISEYLSHVEECRTLARRARSPQDREMVATWESLAEARKKQLNKKASVEE
jgi:hypothetical protein